MDVARKTSILEGKQETQFKQLQALEHDLLATLMQLTQQVQNIEKKLSTKLGKLHLQSVWVESVEVTLEELQAAQSKLMDIVGKI